MTKTGEMRDWMEMNLEQLAAQGLSHAAIGRKAGCDQSLVSYWGKALGIQVGRRKRDWPVEKIRHWVEVEDRIHQWVADQLECSNQQIAKLCKRHDIQTKKTGPRPGPKHYAFRGGKKGGQGSYQARRALAHYGVALRAGRVVHHLNFDSKDNRLENLWVFHGQSEHMSWHRQLEEKARACGLSVEDLALEAYPQAPDLLCDAIGSHCRERGVPLSPQTNGPIEV